MSRIVYIGRFTPPGGGITAKNMAVWQWLREDLPVEQVDLTLLKQGHLSVLPAVIGGLVRRREKLLLGTSAKMRRILSHFLYVCNRRTMEQSLLVVMGGRFGTIIQQDAPYRKWVRGYGKILVETEGMKQQLAEVGVTNVLVFPNCRRAPDTPLSVRKRQGHLRCVCFSMLYPEKGIDTVLEAAEQLPDVEFTFWGPIRDTYQDIFLQAVEERKNCTYAGVFTRTGDALYQMLQQYDVLLFPTRMTGEGVPGTLIEAKIAGLPAVVTPVSFNAELVRDGVEGLVMQGTGAAELAEKIRCLEADDALLHRLKEGALHSAAPYFFEAYTEELTGLLR